MCFENKLVLRKPFSLGVQPKFQDIIVESGCGYNVVNVVRVLRMLFWHERAMETVIFIICSLIRKLNPKSDDWP